MLNINALTRQMRRNIALCYTQTLHINPTKCDEKNANICVYF